MRCEVCGAELAAIKTDLPFKVRESGIVVLKGLSVLQCTNCPQYLLDNAMLARVDQTLNRVDMQRAGYVLLASTCKLSTAAYEFVMRHGQSGERAAAQVNSGYEDIDMSAYADFPGQVYLFTSKGRHTGERASNVICLSPDQMTAFVRNEPILPERVTVWLAIARELSEDTQTV